MNKIIPKRKNRSKHGMTNSPEYQIYWDIKSRCYNPNCKYFNNYGGRGIKMCDRWLDKELGFILFIQDMGLRPSKLHSIERNENDGNYDPLNCKWATKYEQERNKRSNVYIEFNGERKIIKDWARIYNITYQAINNRLKKGMSIEQALTLPKRKYKIK